MKNPRLSLLHLAERHLKERRVEEAVAAFRLYLRGNPNDVRALLQLGICHLLRRSEQEFLAIHRRVQALLARMRTIPEGIGRLWQLYGTLAVKVMAAVAIFGTLSLPGGATPPDTAPRYGGPPFRPAPGPASPSPKAHPKAPARGPAKASPKPGQARIKPSPRPSPAPSARPTGAPSPIDLPVTKYGGPRFRPGN